MFLNNIEHASLTFNKFKVKTWELLQIFYFNALLLFNQPVESFLLDNILSKIFKKAKKK